MKSDFVREIDRELWDKFYFKRESGDLLQNLRCLQKTPLESKTAAATLLLAQAYLQKVQFTETNTTEIFHAVAELLAKPGQHQNSNLFPLSALPRCIDMSLKQDTEGLHKLMKGSNRFVFFVPCHLLPLPQT